MPTSYLPSHPFLIALVIRSFSLALGPTFFQPDEFYQALEPAHHLVFGSGFLSWEWRDLGVRDGIGAGRDVVEGLGRSSGLRGLGGWGGGVKRAVEHLWQETVVRGRMRGWAWPLVFAGVYKVLDYLNLDNTKLLILAPRVVGVLVAALTDYYTSLLASRILGTSSSTTALFLSLTSLFHSHTLPRALSTSPETLLTTMALYYYPLESGRPLTPLKAEAGGSSLLKRSVVGGTLNANEVVPDGKRGSSSVKASSAALTQASKSTQVPVSIPNTTPSNLTLAVMLAALSLCIRPTMAVFWAYLHLETVMSTVQQRGFFSAFIHNLHVIAAGLVVVTFSTLIDFLINYRLTFPFLTFIYQNLFLNLSSFYGPTDPFYHLVQSLPILLFPIWWWWIRGFGAAILPSSFARKLFPASMGMVGPQLRQIARTIVATVLVLSLSPHSEWRFLHPLLPPLLLFAIPPLTASSLPRPLASPTPLTSTAMPPSFSEPRTQPIQPSGTSSFFPCLLHSTHLPWRAFWFILLTPIVPWLYLSTFHGRAQVSVIELLRRNEELSSLVVLMPCHSTPWMSHLHRDVPAWFLTCEPPLDVDPADHWTQESMFYTSPISYLLQVFPYPPVPLHLVPSTRADPSFPSHVVLFGDALGATEVVTTRLSGGEHQPNNEVHSQRDIEGDGDHSESGEEDEQGDIEVVKETVSVRQALTRLGYEEKENLWNGFDIAQDDERRRGGVRVWVRTQGEARSATSW